MSTDHWYYVKLGGTAIGILGAYWWKNSRKRFSVAGKTIVLTGASQGIGAQVSKQLACDHGARVVCIARNASKLDELVKDIKSCGGDALAIVCDCSDEAAIEAKCSKEIKGAAALVHCAGAGRWRFLNEAPASDVRFCLGAPFLSAAFLTRLALPFMVASKQQRSILFVQSPAGIVPVPGATSYSCARWALQGLYENTTADCAVLGSKVNTQLVVLGETNSNYFQNNPDSNQRIPLIAKALIRPVLSSKAAAHVVVNALLSGRAETYAPFMLHLFIIINGIAPSLVRFLIVNTSKAKMDTVEAA